MSVPKVMVVYGTRPEAIKLAPLITSFQEDSRFTTCIVSTGQHLQMLNQVNSLFGIEPDYDLRLMHKRQPLNRIMSRSLKGLDALLDKEKPDALVVQGDTTTAMAAALAGFNRQVKVVHLEAGLRSGDLAAPFPEEANRKLITTVASLHLAPTPSARNNLLAEGVAEHDIVVTGNTVIDALHEASSWEITGNCDDLFDLRNPDKKLVVVTTHRRENHPFFAAIGRAVSRLAERFSEVSFVIPMHLNPVLRDSMLPELEGHENIIVSKPLPYAEFAHLLSSSTLVLTDSGGIQEEAPALGIPVLVMRETSERPEAIEAGTARLVGSNEDRIVREVSRLLTNEDEYQSMSRALNPYGDGHASARSLAAVAELLGVGSRVKEFDPHL